MSHKLTPMVVLVFLTMVAVVLGPSLAFAGDPFQGLAQSIDGAGRTWAPALLVLGALIVGGALMMGSHQSGEKIRNFIFGAVFLVLAAGAGAAILSKMKDLTGM